MRAARVAQVGGKDAPGAGDLKTIISAAGGEVDDERAGQLLA
eukprot:gene5263-49904_t